MIAFCYVFFPHLFFPQLYFSPPTVSLSMFSITIIASRSRSNEKPFLKFRSDVRVVEGIGSAEDFRTHTQMSQHTTRRESIRTRSVGEDTNERRFYEREESLLEPGQWYSTVFQEGIN
jgi:hypothetical protein